MTLNRKKLERILENSFEDYQKEIARAWDTMEEDVQSAFEIILRHSDTTQNPKGVSLFLEEADLKGENINIKFPEWHMEARCLYIEKYGESKGDVIFKKVLIKIFNSIRKSQ